MLPLYAATLALSALLLFWLQPLFTKMVLPLLGGAPAVWVTALLFFQAALLAGYGYAHLSLRLLPPRRQALLHVGLLALPLAALPIGVAEGLLPPPESAPAAWLLALMAASIGLPFVAVATTAPVLQAWFAHTGHDAAASPYFLYAASNAGSVAALLAYPALFEPLMDLRQQGHAWAAGYVALLLAVAACAVLLHRRFAPPVAAAPAAGGLPDAVDWRRRLHWLLLAFAPASLLLGVSLHISTDVAATPLLWVAPLALYLASYVVAFARRPAIPHRLALRLQAFAAILLALLFGWQIKALWLVLGLHLGAFFLTALVCHGELARLRPAARHLTEFYLWLALGGVAGGAVNALLAPQLFDSVPEYPLALLLALALRPGGRAGGRALALDLGLPALFALALLAGARPGPALAGLGLAALVAWHVAVGLGLYAVSGRPLRFALAAGALLLLGGGVAAGRQTLLAERSFFGVHRVLQDGRFRVLLHGTTVHGAADSDAPLTPLTYYHRDGPLGQAFALLPATPGRRVGAVGLGTGSAACYRRPGERWTFFEIDPAVARIARDPALFGFLAGCAPKAALRLGDARLSLQRAPDERFELLLLDAFSSDAIPVHLLTREALALYLDRLAPGGVLLVHISNWHLDLRPVLARLAEDAGLAGRVQDFRFGDPAARRDYRLSSIWAALARRAADLGPLASDPRWRPLQAPAGAPLWTDDVSNLLGVLRWRRAGSAPGAS